MLEQILNAFFGKVPVTDKAVEEASGTIKETLRRKGFKRVEQLTDPILSALVTEALRKASERGKNGVPQVGEFCKQLDWVASNVVAAFTADADTDQRVKNILVFHKALE